MNNLYISNLDGDNLKNKWATMIGYYGSTHFKVHNHESGARRYFNGYNVAALYHYEDNEWKIIEKKGEENVACAYCGRATFKKGPFFKTYLKEQNGYKYRMTSDHGEAIDGTNRFIHYSCDTVDTSLTDPVVALLERADVFKLPYSMDVLSAGVSLLLNDLFGGQIKKGSGIDGADHYFNLINKVPVDILFEKFSDYSWDDIHGGAVRQSKITLMKDVEVRAAYDRIVNDYYTTEFNDLE